MFSFKNYEEKKKSGAESCHDGRLSNPRLEELINSVFLHLCFIVLLSVTMEGQLETNTGCISQQRYKESKKAETKKVCDFREIYQTVYSGSLLCQALWLWEMLTINSSSVLLRRADDGDNCTYSPIF